MQNKIAAVLLGCMLAWSAGGAMGSDDLSDEGVGVLLDLKTINEVLEFGILEEEGFEPPGKWMTLRAFAARLPEAYRDRLPSKDPWGGAFAILSHEQEMVVVSAGPDGLNEVVDVFETHDDPGEEAKRRIRASDDVILVVGGGVVKGPPDTSRFQRETMSVMKALGSHLKRYSAEHLRYPSRGFQLGTLAQVAPELQSDSPGSLPLEDAWGYPLLYWSDTREFMIVSTGADGVLDRDPSAVTRGVGGVEWLGEFTGADTDLVWVGDRFTQWPRIHTHH